MKRFCLVFISVLLPQLLFSQKGFDFRYWEDSLIRLRNTAIHAPTELERYQANEDFMNLLESVLNEPNSFKFGWDSVRNFSVLTSPDASFKLFTWAVEKNDRTVENFGFIHVRNDNRKKYVLFPLNDKRHNIDYPKTYVGNQNNWYGAVYYKIIPLKTESKTYYTLLGYNANNLFTNEKVIEVLYFKSSGKPVFGATIFKKYPEKVSRVIFEYAKNSTFSLKYERHGYDVATGKRDAKTHRRIYETVYSDMIVFEQLIPLEDGLDGIPSFAVPEASLHQGFIPDKGKWLFVNSVQGRNPDKKLPKYVLKERDFTH